MLKHKTFKTLIKWAFVANTVAYICSCLTPYIHPQYFFPLTFFALIFPLLLFSMLFWLLWFVFAKNKKAIWVIFVIVLGYKNIGSNVGFSINENHLPNTHKKIKLLSWNVRNFIGHDSLLLQRSVSPLYFNFIKNINADVVCLQDAIDIIDTAKEELTGIFDTQLQQYKFKYFSADIDKIKNGKEEKYGTCILSKYPIAFSNHINYEGKNFTESLGFANINVDGKPIRIYNTHLKSMYIKIAEEQKNPQYFDYQIEDTNLVFHGTAIEKIKRFDLLHIQQAQLIKKVMDTTTIPFVFCGDLNSTPSSYVYHTLSKNLHDTYLQNKLGLEATYLSKLPFLRIDVVLCSKELQAINYHSPRYRLSDHCPIITEIALPN